MGDAAAQINVIGMKFRIKGHSTDCTVIGWYVTNDDGLCYVVITDDGQLCEARTGHLQPPDKKR